MCVRTTCWRDGEFSKCKQLKQEDNEKFKKKNENLMYILVV